MKLLQDNKKLHAEEFSNASPYIIMFGPDKCGATNKVNFTATTVWVAYLIKALGPLHLQAQEPEDWGVRREAPQECPVCQDYQDHQSLYPNCETEQRLRDSGQRRV
jgi:hypothetical protein